LFSLPGKNNAVWPTRDYKHVLINILSDEIGFNDIAPGDKKAVI
jgi:hypothetical protein